MAQSKSSSEVFFSAHTTGDFQENITSGRKKSTTRKSTDSHAKRDAARQREEARAPTNEKTRKQDNDFGAAHFGTAPQIIKENLPLILER